MNQTLAPARASACPPRVQLEQASAGDWLPGVQGHVEGCTSCAAQVKSMQAMTAEFLAARPEERFVKQLDARAAQQPRRRSPLLAFAGALGALVLAAGVTQWLRPAGVTMKGGLTHITLKRGEQISSLGASSKLAAGDALRFSVLAPHDGYAVVLERDSTGKVTVVAPFDAKEPKAVNQGTSVLPDSAVLDATPGAETFITVFSTRAFDLPAVVQSAQRIDLQCDGCLVEVSTFDKP
jgi:hypothetical protein